MNNAYKSIMNSLSEAIQDAKGTGKKSDKRIVTAIPVKR